MREFGLGPEAAKKLVIQFVPYAMENGYIHKSSSPEESATNLATFMKTLYSELLISYEE